MEINLISPAVKFSSFLDNQGRTRLHPSVPDGNVSTDAAVILFNFCLIEKIKTGAPSFLGLGEGPLSDSLSYPVIFCLKANKKRHSWKLEFFLNRN
jgi:hypothetical protein